MFAEMKQKLHATQKSLADGGTDTGGPKAEEMDEVVDRVQSRWTDSIDKEEPEIADEFLRKMKDAINEIHSTEGFKGGKIVKPEGDDWLTKLVASNSKMQSMIPPPPDGKPIRAIWDS